MRERRTIQYTGTVQGVGFRWRTWQLLREFPVEGFVRNEPDGTVRLVLEGAPEALDGAAELVRGTLAPHIQRENAESSPASGEFQGFEIRR